MANDIDIVIGAQDKATNVLDSVAGKVALFGGGIGAAVTGLKSGFDLIGNALSGIVGPINAASYAIDQLYDQARGLGESSGMLRVFQFAMQEAGNVSAEQSINALRKLQRVVGEVASDGVGEVASVFQQLQLDARSLSMESPVQQFLAVKNAIGSIQNVSERASIAQKVLGRSAAELMPALIGEADSFRESMLAAVDLGATIGESGAAGIASMNDSIDRASLGIEGLWNQISSALAPVIESIAIEVSSWLPPIIDLASRYLPSLIDASVQLAGVMADILEMSFTISTLQWWRTAEIAASEGRQVTWLRAVTEARQRASEQAQKNAEIAISASRGMISGERDLEGAINSRADAESKAALAAEQSSNRAYESVIARLERQYAVAVEGEDAVRFQEDVATARDDAERFRIEQLHRELELQKLLDDAEKERLKTEQEQLRVAERKKQEDDREREKRDQDILQREKNKKAVAPELQATESRLLTRGRTGLGPEALTAKHTFELVQRSKRQERLMERMLAKTGFTLEVVK